MNIPNYSNTPLVEKNGNISDSWQPILMQLFSSLQNILTNNVVIIPAQTSEQISSLQSNSSNFNGALVYNSDSNQLMVNVNGEFKFILTS